MADVFIATPLPQESLDALSAAGVDYEMWDSQTPISAEELAAKVADSEVLISAVNVKVPASVISAAPKLKLIANVGDGYSNIDLAAAKTHGVAVTNAPGRDSIASTAEQTVTSILALSRDLLAGDAMMKANAFPGWEVTGYLGGHQVYGKKLLIIGLGRIGSLVAKMLHAFDMDIAYVDPVPAAPDLVADLGLTRMDLDEGLAWADYVSLNCDLNADNHLMISAPQLALMRPEAYLINCARGPLVKESDLVAALKSGQIRGAALDTYEFEPKVSPALAALPNVVLTPHVGNATVEARKEMAKTAVDNAINHLQGKPLQFQVQ